MGPGGKEHTQLVQTAHVRAHMYGHRGQQKPGPVTWGKGWKQPRLCLSFPLRDLRLAFP